ncbi:hypothetical protein [Verrucosispora sp. WMMC514]|uniref:hypothetical protein n=1 Tax=Verrucosispora sp. WMMC514 TaxID=3015156 RepID=UPI00248B244B|nr:hypothetical protein [Verrucosispora sp. WMMC514]WBB94131.1 hypothetical protein O7597_14880 [Verrucosispora sp. WMMC514]
MDVTTATPAEIDTRLIELWMAQAHHRAIADSDRLSDSVRAYAAQAAADAVAEAAPLEAAYAARRWNRWYWVPKGHLHREGECSTLYASTDRNLTAAASGMDDAQIVERYGWNVCTICVPNAPVLDGFRTPGTYATAEADAKGICLNKIPAHVNRRYASPYGTCGDCDAQGIAVTSLGRLRQHPHARMAADDARKARIEDPKLIGTATGEVLKVDGWEIKTRRTAEIDWVRHMENADERGWAGNPEWQAEQRGFARQIAEALAAKDGVTVEQIEAALMPKVDAKIRKWQREMAKANH